MPGNFVAGGNIAPATIVKRSTSADFTVVAATAATDIPVGVAQDATHDPPGVTGSAAWAAEAGDPLRVYQEGEECLVKVGTGGVTRGDRLVAEADSEAVTAPTTGTNVVYVVGHALESGVAGSLVRMIVQIYAYRPALT
jgi:hypothetical protein